jgi:hypothetical protein
MASNPLNSGESARAAGDSEEVTAAQRSLWFWFALILGVNVVGLVWLSVRAESPPFVRSVLDIFLHGATGALAAYLAFRALLRFPYRFPDLLIMVSVLSLGMKMTVDFVKDLGAMGIVSTDLASGERFGEIFQLCLWSGSVLVAGAALGLRNCTLLKIDSFFRRALTLISGMLVLPAMAGVVVFPVMLVRSLFAGHMSTLFAVAMLAQWIGSVVATSINSRCFMKTLTLTAEVDAQEKLPHN